MTDQAERLRQLSKSRQQEAAEKPSPQHGFSRVIVVASGKGGVGKTNLVVNLSIAMSKFGENILILDTDLGMANVDILLDLTAKYTLIDVLKGEKELEDVVLQGPFNVEVIPGGAGLSEIVSLDGQQREQLISRLSLLERKNSTLIVDCAAGLSREVLSFMAAGDEIVLVTTTEPTALADVYGIIKVLANYRLQPSVRLVVNMTGSFSEGKIVYDRLNSVCRRFLEIGVHYLGSIEFDMAVQKSVHNCYPYVLQFPRSKPAQSTIEIARNLLSGEVSPGEAEKNKGGFFRRLLNLWSDQ